MTETRVQELESKLFELIQLITEPALWNFLTEKERERISQILQQV